ncbi:Biopolymer transport protein ExbB [Maioricimonas rarisocia]|uniref:Biopolymer transport protein ExbB n=1 Tax=Maioricimonas rarisocia TaxID=2528026 RepID=A0A517Z603_9PLAN|nr:MotA/TolQ/ExbB proton channel family protein [Maioricimonas rarisocia]QDU37916.1 Biopolymer transport protein ExbB [Maioricimonas rarisocia]
MPRLGRAVGIALAQVLLVTASASAQDASFFQDGQVDVPALIRAGGIIGWIIVGLSVAMVALILEHLMSIRRGSLMPRRQAEELHQLIANNQYNEAETLCRQRHSFLGFVVGAGLQETGLGYTAVEKGMEDAAQEQAARLYRKIEYLSVIGTLAPMLGLMGTVWGMIQAFGEFAEAAVPQPADFAPAISQALVTTLMGLAVAVPALAAFAIFRNRIDEFVAETSLVAEHIIKPLKRSIVEKRKGRPAATGTAPTAAAGSRPSVPTVAMEREPRR